MSTDRQGASGLGLEAQRAAVLRHIATAQLAAEYTEVESGKKHTNRPQLLAALTGEALYALHVSGDVPTNDPVYEKGVQWLLRNQLADGSWFMPTRAVPVQPHTFESGFPHGWHQF